MASKPRIVQLAQTIASQTALLEEYLHQNGVPEPSFAVDGLTDPFEAVGKDIDKARKNVMEAAIELRQLLEGPVKLLLPECNFAPLASIHRFKMASFVPLTGRISFAELAKNCGLFEHDLRRIIRYAAIHHRVFSEPEPGFVAHTASSKLLAENPKIGELMGLTFAESWPAHARSVDALEQKSEEPNISGYALANNTSLNMFEFLGKHPERAQRFAGAISSTSQASLDALTNYFDWGGLPDGSRAVDVGGAQGHVSVHLARRFPHLHFTGAEEKIPEQARGRIAFLGHDMFTNQPVEGARVYLLRYVLHDWPDKYCIKVLQSLLPAMKKGAKVVIQDHILPEPGTLGLLQEMQIRSMDAIIISLFNSREREVNDWEMLFRSASLNFQCFSATRVKENPSTGIITAEWDDPE